MNDCVIHFHPIASWTISWNIIFYNLYLNMLKLKIFLCLTKHKAIKVDGSGCLNPRFLGISTSLRWVVSLTLRPIYPGEKSLWCPLVGPQNRSGRHGELKIIDPTGTPNRPTHSYPILILLPRLYLKYIMEIYFEHVNCKELVHEPIGTKTNVRIP
jgi:hypothetical protein